MSEPPPIPPEEERPDEPDTSSWSQEAEAEPYEPASETGKIYEAPSDEEKRDTTWQTLCHLSTLLWLFGLAVVHLLAPLGIWYFLKRDDPEVERAAKEAFNFQVNMLLWDVVGGLMIMTCILAPVGIVLFVLALILSAVLPIVAAVKTSNGKDYRYPLTFRFLD